MAQGGFAISGGGTGLGAGRAIFNQGNLTLNNEGLLALLTGATDRRQRANATLSSRAG
jgi:hypothetical protein